MPLSNSRASLILLLCMCALALVMLTGLVATTMSLDLESMRLLGALLVLQSGLTLYCRARRMVRLQAVVETNLFFTLATVLLLPISYIAIRIGMPLADDWLVWADSSLAFDWTSFIQFVDARPWLASALLYSYMSFHLQLLLLPVYFAVFSRSCRGQAIVFAYVLIVLLSSVLSIWFPTQGAYVAHGAQHANLQSIDTVWAFSYLTEFAQIRTKTHFVMRLASVEGVLTFPSVHAAVALLCTWAALGSRYLFLPVAIVNIAMAFAAISHASHFMVDILAGFAVAAMCIWIAAKTFSGFGLAASRADEAEFLAEIRARFRSRKGAAVAAMAE